MHRPSGWPASLFLFALPAWSAKNCGQINVAGYDTPVSIITTEWNVPGEKAGEVFVEDGAVVPYMSGRSYLGDACSSTPGEYDNTQYVAFKLLGKRLRYTVNLTGALCGCNAALYLTSLKQNDNVSECSDYYCDANSVCGVRCAEIDIQEANQHGWHSTLHVAADGAGAAHGYGGGGPGWSGPRDWTEAQYGPGGECIDTDKPFQVEAAFPTDGGGNLVSMDMELSQEGSSCPLKVSIAKYTYKDTDTMAEITAALEEGMAPIISYWKSADMLWLDGDGTDKKGPCEIDNTTFKNCTDSVSFYDFSISDIPSQGTPWWVFVLVAMAVLVCAVLVAFLIWKLCCSKKQDGSLLEEAE